MALNRWRATSLQRIHRILGTVIVSTQIIGQRGLLYLLRNYFTVHFYTYLLDGWNPVIYPNPRFASEYGFQSIPSLTSWNRVMAGSDKLTELLDHRQHHPLGNAPIIDLIKKHFFLPDESSPNYMQALIYLSQVSQAMVIKAETEHYMSRRDSNSYTMGALYWQLNDVWIAPSWSSIDFHGTFKVSFLFMNVCFMTILLCALFRSVLGFPNRRLKYHKYYAGHQLTQLTHAVHCLL